MSIKNIVKAACFAAIIFCLWGLWDLSLWNSLYPGMDYSFPFRLLLMPWFIAGDIFVCLAALAGFILVCVGGDD